MAGRGNVHQKGKDNSRSAGRHGKQDVQAHAHEHVAEIPLRSKKYPGLVAIIDPEDYDLVEGYDWYPHKTLHTFYADTNAFREDDTKTTLRMHRLILPTTKQVDHINGNGLDNRMSNLRTATRSQSGLKDKRQTGGTSQYRGVYRKRARWHAQAQLNGKKYNLGVYDHEQEAARAYDDFAAEYYGAFARLNFPDELGN